MPTTTNIVNLDALITRADLAMPGEAAEDITSLPITGLSPKGFLYPALRKPDFQRETANWTPEQVSDLINTFVGRDLIPAVILWRAGQHVFVIDGAHRLSALIAWVHNDYGDGEISRKFFQNQIPYEQQKAADKTRDLVNSIVGSYRDHELAIEYPERARPDVASRANRLGWQEIPAQWIRNADHDKAEKSFFRINQGGTKIDPTEARILGARRSATALAARAILRAGTGHSYWNKFSEGIRIEIERLGGEIYRLLYEPSLTLPIKTLDVPLAGQGYGPHVLPFLFDLVTLVNDTGVADSSHKRVKGEALAEDPDGTETVRYLTNVRSMLYRLLSVHASSLGLHPGLYFYTQSGVFQPAALLSFVAFFNSYGTLEFKQFVRIRSQFESFLMKHRGVTEAVRLLGSGGRSRPRLLSLYGELVKGFSSGKNEADVTASIAAIPDFQFLFAQEAEGISKAEASSSTRGRKFSRDTKGAAYLRDALPTAPKCPTCGGIMHRNGMQTGHKQARRDGGLGTAANAAMQHPFCNSTMDN
jgi:hypothetical protein